jgi:hypothetical protein
MTRAKDRRGLADVRGRRENDREHRHEQKTRALVSFFSRAGLVPCSVLVVDNLQKLPLKKILKKGVQLAVQMNDFLDFLIRFGRKHLPLAIFQPFCADSGSKIDNFDDPGVDFSNAGFHGAQKTLADANFFGKLGLG